MVNTTPLRTATTPAGGSTPHVLSDAGLSYADGAEEDLARIVGEAEDLSSSSRELGDRAWDWATGYSLSPTRANVLRALDLPPQARVLEVGCGCGPITRHLGEHVALVDSLEPMPARARVAALRTRDLDGVQVFVGTLDDVPLEPAYDAVVVVGVLEYLGGGTDDPAPYLAFLERCRRVLVPGGTLVLAIENPLGVKYIAGAAEDHTNRPFDSLENYALKSPARTFSRARLTSMLRTAGYDEVRTLSAFPDYKMPRVLLAEEAYDRAPGLASHLPQFPSPDHVVRRLQLADEGMLWRQLVGAGVGPDFANSFVVLATVGEGATFWPADRLAVAFNTERQPEYALRTDVVLTEGDEVEVRRRPLFDVRAREEAQDVRQVPPGPEALAHGTELVELLVHEPDRAAQALARWAELLPDDEWMPVDLVPHNIIVADDGALQVVDQEWFVRGFGRRNVLVRGLLWATSRVAVLQRPELHDPPRRVLDVMNEMARHVGLELTDEVLADFVAHESRFLATVNATHSDEAVRRARSAEDLRALFEQDMLTLRGGLRFDVQWSTAVVELERAAERQREHEETRQELERVRARAVALEDRVRRMPEARLRALVGRTLRRLHLR